MTVSPDDWDSVPSNNHSASKPAAIRFARLDSARTILRPAFKGNAFRARNGNLGFPISSGIAP